MGERARYVRSAPWFLFAAVAVALGKGREFWWVWLIWWALAEVGALASDRLIYWQRQTIARYERGEDQP